MDLLCIPANPSFPVEKTRYACKGRWDGKEFLTYAHRTGRLRSVHPLSRSLIPSLPSGEGTVEEPFLEHLYPTPQEELEDFLQTWLFFGLLAEIFGLNEVEGGGRPVGDDATRTRELDALYVDFVVEEDGVQYITGSRLQEPQAANLIIKRLGEGEEAVVRRVVAIQKCLRLTSLILQTSIHGEFDRAIRYSIAALGELVGTAVNTAKILGKLPQSIPIQGLNWRGNYIDRRGGTETKMLEAGWCRSEIEKIRLTYPGLGTQYYLSRLRKNGSGLDHERCLNDSCIAFQIHGRQYEPAHTHGQCKCDKIPNDNDSEAFSQKVVGILRSTETYPVLRVKNPDPVSGMRVTVEPYQEGTRYVAISHVWADGMGNPKENALPRCQVARLASFVAALAASTERPENVPSSGTNPDYAIWIDTLLCPIPREDKAIALQRIRNVYRQARHVLVLDASLMCYKAADLDPAEILLRIFCASTWMRRLWTLQEGVLAGSLYFQFADKAVYPPTMASLLFKQGVQRLRYMPLSRDVSVERVFFENWFHPQPGLAKRKLAYLQRALYFRTVSEPADEALCIATLMSLDLAPITAVTSAQDRMERVWEQLSKSDDGASGGNIPSAILFSADETLQKPGWRWAPLSLLAASEGNLDSGANFDDRFTRFRPLSVVADDTDPRPSLGVTTPQGLRVQLPGLLLRSVPLADGLPLHPWGRISHPREDVLLIRSTSGKWLRVIDFYRARHLAGWTSEQRDLYDERADNAVCREIHSGRCAIIFPPGGLASPLRSCLMVQLEEAGAAASLLGSVTTGRELHARRRRLLIVDEPDKGVVKWAEVTRDIAGQVAREPITRALLDAAEGEYENALEIVRARIKALTAERWAADPEFAKAVHDTLGPDLKDFAWVQVPKMFSHDVIFEELSESQVWLAD